ncbi:MAG: histidine phosphatase family protein [Clostridia bacterium]|nr:histidine phosphatase family protein [Clostridia bacterium]
MTKIYFVRHCESVANRDRIIQGTKDFDISPEGESQLEALKARFGKIHIDKIYSSPLTRTYKTALAIKGEKDVEIEKDIGFIEFNFGDIQGMHHETCQQTYPELYEVFKTHFYDMDAPGGETYKHFYETVWTALQRVISENKGKTVAIASHGGTIRALFTRLLFDDMTRVHDTSPVVNTAVFEVDFQDDGSFDIKMMNDDSHLNKKAAVRLEI